MKITAIILAAGASVRMKRAKQLLPWKNTTLLGHAMDIASASQAQKVVLVLGAREGEIRNAMENRECEVVINTEWEKGLGSSIGAGISNLISGKDSPDAVLLILGDQPLLDAEYLDLLIGHFRKGDGDIVCTDYGEKLGVPAIFDRKYFPELSRLKGDRGAGKLIANHLETTFAIQAGEKTTDVDTLRDYFAVINIKTTTDS